MRPVMEGGRTLLRRCKPRSLQARQLLAASLCLVAFLALAGYSLGRVFAQTARSNLRQQLKSYALAYAKNIDFARDGSLYTPDLEPDPRFGIPGSGLYAQVVLPSGHWASLSAEGPLLPQARMLEPRQESFGGPYPVTQIDGSQGEVYRYGVGYIWANGAPEAEFPYTIYVLEDASVFGAQLRVFKRSVWVYLGGAGLTLLLLQGLILQWSLSPLKRVVRELVLVQRGQAQRMSEHHPHELEPLTDSINALIQSERENLEHQHNTLADLAHSLKTPLAVMRTQLDSDGDAEALRRELDIQLKKMNDLVSYQLARAASGGHKLFARPLEIEPSAEEIVRGLEKVYAARGVLCEFEIDPAARFHGESGDMQELLGNLLENAFKWARRRVLLTVRATPPPAGARRAGLVLVVEDDGPGIAPENVARVLQRGVRGDERVQGHGIGLSIVQDLVRDYRGRMDVAHSDELGGARFEVTLPAGP